MAITHVSISNFKGISEKSEFEIRPITLFIGPNSSGKSSCIHAIASMAQTVKLASSKLPIVLDDEFAQVHLGRFIEVIHSKSYSDAIEIGLTYRLPGKIALPGGFSIGKNDSVTACFSFKSTKRTQDIYIEKAIFSTPALKVELTKLDDENYLVSVNDNPTKFHARHTGGFGFIIAPPAQGDSKHDDFFNVLLMIQVFGEVFSSELRDVLYLGPFRQSPLRRYPTRGSAPNEVGPQGEAAITLLANEYVQRRSRSCTKQIGKWMQSLGLGKGVDVSRVGGSDLFDVAVTLPDGAKFTVADLGYGISQVLPVLTQCAFAPKGSTLLFEQPELHLHPGAARGLASVFIEAVNRSNLHIVAETHSRDMFIQLLDEIRSGKVSLNDVAAYKVSRFDGCSHFERIKIVEEDGHIEVLNPWDGELLRR